MSTNKKQKQFNKKEEFDIRKELEFWNSYSYSEESESKLIERFKKIRNEKISKEEAKIISDNMLRVIPAEKHPVFFLKIYLELPKKECGISGELNETIKQLCKTILEKSNIDPTYFNSIGKAICSSESPESIIAGFIEKVQSTVDKNCYKDADVLAISYIWLVQNCKEYRIFEYWKKIALIEKVFVELLRSEKEKDLRDCILKSIPKAIANKTYRKQFLNSSYLYIEDQKKLRELEKKRSTLESTVGTLLSEKHAQGEKIESLNKKIFELETALSSTRAECEQLQADLVLKGNMLNFEKNRFEQQFISKEKNLMSEVESIIGLEIEGIEEIAYRLPEREQDRILRRIRRIRERIIELGGNDNA